MARKRALAVNDMGGSVMVITRDIQPSRYGGPRGEKGSSRCRRSAGEKRGEGNGFGRTLKRPHRRYLLPGVGCVQLRKGEKKKKKKVPHQGIERLASSEGQTEAVFREGNDRKALCFHHPPLNGWESRWGKGKKEGGRKTAYNPRHCIGKKKRSGGGITSGSFLPAPEKRGREKRATSMEDPWAQ